MDHYFTEDARSQSEPREISLIYDNKTYRFITDQGVFSKNRLDFGTELLLKTTMEGLEGDVLDLGTGYGPVGVLVNLNRSISCDMVDVNRRALELARKNLELNRARGRVFYSDGFSRIDRTYDTILFNPPIRRGKELIYRLFEEAKSHLKEAGRLVIVIQKKQGMASAKKELERIYDRVEILDKRAGYYILEARI